MSKHDIDENKREISTPDEEPSPRKHRARRLKPVNYLFQIVFSKPREKALPCKSKGCHLKTSGRKPFCIKCLNKMPYVKQIKADLSRSA